MRPLLFLALVMFRVTAAACGQSVSSDAQTLQALLAEVRSLRADLRSSLARIQTGQILLTRLQLQQGAVARASERRDDARSKLMEIQLRQKESNAEVKRLEEAQSAEGNVPQQKALQDRISHVKSELEVVAEEQQQRQAAEIQAEQQFRAEQDKLTVIETQLDELTRTMGNSADPSGRNGP